MSKELITFLEQFVLEARLQKFKEVLQYRTEYATVVLENIFQSQNANAVLRTCDCFGVQDVHIIENNNEYEINPDVSLGATKWLKMHHYNKLSNNTPTALNRLKDNGYRIVATSPHAKDIDLMDFDVTKGKFALVFGTELTGISDDVRNEADEFIKIPMYGFTESFNISVSVAICLQTLIPKLHSSKVRWELEEERYDELYLYWLRNSIRHVEKLERHFQQVKG